MGGCCTTCKGTTKVGVVDSRLTSDQPGILNCRRGNSKTTNSIHLRDKFDEAYNHQHEISKSFLKTNSISTVVGRRIQRRIADLSTPLVLKPEPNHAGVAPSSFVSMDFLHDLMEIVETGALHGWEGLFSAVRGICQHVIGAQTANLFVIDESSTHLITILGNNEARFPMPTGDIKRVIDERKVFKMKQPTKGYDWRTVDGTHCSSVHSYLCMPIIISSSGDVVGILELFSKNESDMRISPSIEDQQKHEILKVVAHMTALSLNHMFKEEQDIITMLRMKVQVEVSRQLLNVVGLRGLFQVVQNRLLNVIGFEAVTLYIHDEMEQTIWTYCPHLGKLVIGLQEKCILAHVFDTGENLLLTEASSHPQFNESLDSPDGMPVRDMAVVPIMNPKRSGTCIGLLQVCNKREEWRELLKEAVVSEDDMLMLESLSLHLAAALHTAQMDQNCQQDMTVHEFYGTCSFTIPKRRESLEMRKSYASIVSASSTAFGISLISAAEDTITRRKWSEDNGVSRTFRSSTNSLSQLDPMFILSECDSPHKVSDKILTEDINAEKVDPLATASQMTEILSLRDQDDPCMGGVIPLDIQENPMGNGEEKEKSPPSCKIQEIDSQAHDHSHKVMDIVFHPDMVSVCLGMAEVEDEVFAGLNIEDPGLNLLSFTPSQLNTIVLAMFQAFDLPRAFNIPIVKLERFIERVAMNYHSGNHFHNWTHAVTILHVIFVSLVAIKDVNRFMSLLDVLALFIGALAHDVDHTGQNNTFHIQSASTLALRYNDRSVLEAHSASTLYNLITDPAVNILASLSKQDYSTVRVLVLAMILETDLAAHEPQLSRLVGHSNFAFDRECIEDRKLVTSVILHAADLSNPTRPFDQAQQWARLLAQEMMTQVKLEKSKNMQVAPFMEGLNDEVSCAKGEIFFISTFSQPLWDVVAEIFPALRYRADTLQENLEAYAQFVEKKSGEVVKIKKRKTPQTEPQPKKKHEDEISVKSLPGNKVGNTDSVFRPDSYWPLQRYSLTNSVIIPGLFDAEFITTPNWLRRSTKKRDGKGIVRAQEVWK